MKKTHIIYIPLIITALLISITCTSRPDPPDIPPMDVIPSAGQIEYQKMEFIGFIHFTVNTFTDKEWGFGDESPEIFNPVEFDPEQWARTAREAGMKQLILTVKHHDGFCLWPSKLTEHSVKNSTWRNGGGDIVGEFVDACRKFGLKVGFYLSPWDRNHRDYGNSAYMEYYRGQLRELLTLYGEISEVWFDGAMGGSGYYGGANEDRLIDRTSYYDWPNTWGLVKQLQPGALIFSDAGPDIRWIGNEKGFAGETNWSTITTKGIVVGNADMDYLNSGDSNGLQWTIGLCNTSIRPGWFFHAAENDRVKSPQELMEVYYKSVGRNGVLLLNIPPDQRGLFHKNDIRSLMEFKRIRDETFTVNLAFGKKTHADNTRMRHRKFSSANILDESTETYWAADDGIEEATITIDLGSVVEFDRIMLQEPIRFGQRISEFEIQTQISGQWTPAAKGTTIGYKRILRISPVRTDKVRILIKRSLNSPALSNFGLYKASARENPD